MTEIFCTFIAGAVRVFESTGITFLAEHDGLILRVDKPISFWGCGMSVDARTG